MAGLQRKLAIALSKLPKHPCNDASLEQYVTEGDFAARWLTAMVEAGDLGTDTAVVDLGAGNGILGIGAVLLGAPESTLVEIDEDALGAARAGAATLHLESSVNFLSADIHEWQEWPAELACDLVVMNPPWGFQTHAADRPFIEAALSSPAKAIHLLHSAEASHPQAMARDGGWKTEVILEGEFRLPPSYSHHSQRNRSTPVKCWRFTR